jgi:RHS repeat-associated protein
MSVDYSYNLGSGSTGTDASSDWRSEAAPINTNDPGDRTARAGARSATSTRRTRHPAPADLVGALPSTRVVNLDYEWDWLGNEVSRLDDAWSFYERSLGTLTSGNDANASAPRPSALYLATNIDDVGGVESTWDGAGWVEVQYGVSGNVTSFTVHGECHDVSSGSCVDDPTDTLATRIASLRTQCSCATEQHYSFRWDELNRLVDGRRYDRNSTTSGAWVHGARLRYRYDGANQRTVKEVLTDPTTGGGGDGGFGVGVGGGGGGWTTSERVTLFVYPGDYERRGLTRTWSGYQAITTGTDATETQYLVAGARIVWDSAGDGLLPPIDRNRRATINVTDLLGTTGAVVDLLSGDLVEVSTYYPNGARENLWTNDALVPLEPMGFTTKEADEEIGVTYFGERWLIPRLGRWATPDPLHVHASGGGEALNSYHYVSGNLLQAVDPLGLECEGPGCGGTGDWVDPEARMQGHVNEDGSMTFAPYDASPYTAHLGEYSYATVEELQRSGDYGAAAEAAEAMLEDDAESMVTSSDFERNYEASRRLTPVTPIGPDLTGPIVEATPGAVESLPQAVAAVEGGVAAARGMRALGRALLSRRGRAPAARPPPPATPAAAGPPPAATPGCSTCTCFVAGTLVALGDGRLVPIESVRVGERVAAPVGISCAETAEPVVRIELELVGPIFGRAELLRSGAWLRTEGWTLGARIWLDDPEVGTAAARVTSIGSFQPEAGEGCAVTATVEHDSPSTVLVVLEDGETLEATPAHPFFVEELNAFVPAGELRVGWTARRLRGGGLRIASVVEVREPNWVFNLEVDTAHSYGVGSSEVWVHNQCAARRAGVPTGTIQSPPGTARQYTRPSAAGPTAAQHRAVQGRPCVDCGAVEPAMVPDHIDPIVVEYFGREAWTRWRSLALTRCSPIAELVVRSRADSCRVGRAGSVPPFQRSSELVTTRAMGVCGMVGAIAAPCEGLSKVRVHGS